MSRSILAFAGKRNSGKSTACRYVHALFMAGIHVEDEKLLDWVSIDDDGNLVVPADNEEGQGLLDLNVPSLWLEENVSPIVKKFSFCDATKEICANILQMDRSLLWGSDKDKETPSKFTFKQVNAKPPIGKKPADYMTYRDVVKLEAERYRLYSPKVWAAYTLNAIDQHETELAVIDDARHLVEINLLHENGGKVIRLMHANDNTDIHNSEKELDRISKEAFDAIIPDTSMRETHEIIHKLLIDWKIVNEG